MAVNNYSTTGASGALQRWHRWDGLRLLHGLAPLEREVTTNRMEMIATPLPMATSKRICQKCRSTIPHAAETCPFCGDFVVREPGDFVWTPSRIWSEKPAVPSTAQRWLPIEAATLLALGVMLMASHGSESWTEFVSGSMFAIFGVTTLRSLAAARATFAVPTLAIGLLVGSLSLRCASHGRLEAADLVLALAVAAVLLTTGLSLRRR